MTNPDLREVIAGSKGSEITAILAMLGLGSATFPAAGANGSVTQGQRYQDGKMGVSPAVIVGDGTTSQFSVPHDLGVQALDVRAYIASAGALGAALEPNWTWTPGSFTSSVDLSFAHDLIPVAGQTIYVAVLG